MRKYFEVINTVTWFDDDYENETLVLTPGQIVEIELDDVPNFYPCLILDNDMLDIAFDTWEEFYEFFKRVPEFELKSLKVEEEKLNENADCVYPIIKMTFRFGTNNYNFELDKCAYEQEGTYALNCSLKVFDEHTNEFKELNDELVELEDEIFKYIDKVLDLMLIKN